MRSTAGHRSMMALPLGARPRDDVRPTGSTGRALRSKYLGRGSERSIRRPDPLYGLAAGACRPHPRKRRARLVPNLPARSGDYPDRFHPSRARQGHLRTAKWAARRCGLGIRARHQSSARTDLHWPPGRSSRGRRGFVPMISSPHACRVSRSREIQGETSFPGHR